jgi:hypothetical protein
MAPMALANLDVIQLHLFHWTQADAMDALWTQGVSVSPYSSFSPVVVNFFAWVLRRLTSTVNYNPSTTTRQLQPVNSSR